MNKKVKQLGGTSKFLNSSGLTAAGQLANAYDFSIITLHASTKRNCKCMGTGYVLFRH